MNAAPPDYNAVYFDSNELLANGWLDPSLKLDNFLHIGRGWNLRAFIPAPVLDETEAHWSRAVEAQASRLASAKKEFERLARPIVCDVRVEYTNFEEMTTQYRGCREETLNRLVIGVIPYRRVSTLDQNTDRQLEGVKLDKVFTDKASGRDTNRPQLQGALDYLREGDLFVIHSMDRLARNLDDLRRIVLDLTGKGVHVQFVKENLTFTGEDSPMSNLLLSLLGAVAEFERSMIRERQREGIALAKKAGVYKGRKPSLTTVQVAEIRKRVAAGEKKARLAAEYRISRQTLYSALG
jgi:DNA invertase Pin-like site-specific DNA recombinase